MMSNLLVSASFKQGTMTYWMNQNFKLNKVFFITCTIFPIIIHCIIQLLVLIYFCIDLHIVFFTGQKACQKCFQNMSNLSVSKQRT